MRENAISFQDALDASQRFRLVETEGCLVVEEGNESDSLYDIEQVIHLVALALESGREVFVERKVAAR